MTNVPFAAGDWERRIAKEADLTALNVYYEENPALTNEGAALLARPGLKRYMTVGSGPIRGIYSAPGAFNDALFVVSGSEWYRIDTNDAVTLLASGIAGGAAPVSMTGTGNIGDVQEILFLADGTALRAYTNGAVTPVATPDNVGIISVGYVSSHVVCIPAQGAGVNGRFYWIQPGEITIDPLNYATAERAPDPVSSVVVFGDQFWLPGTSTTEVWYFTGEPENPVLRLKGVVFDRGAWGGTATQVKDSMVIVDNDGSVFQISGGMKRISNPSVAEQIRVAQAAQINGG